MPAISKSEEDEAGHEYDQGHSLCFFFTFAGLCSMNCPPESGVKLSMQSSTAEHSEAYEGGHSEQTTWTVAGWQFPAHSALKTRGVFGRSPPTTYRINWLPATSSFSHNKVQTEGSPIWKERESQRCLTSLKPH